MMEQALRRFTAIISELTRHPDGLALHAVAQACRLPPATCTRALKAMVELGWADQDANRGAYRQGPLATALSAAVPYQGRLLQQAVPLLRRLAGRHPGTGVSVVALRHAHRFGLWSQGPDGASSGRLELFPHDDLWGMPSGRLLVAMRPLRDRNRWIASAGLPTRDQWPGVAGRRELLAELAQIRREGRAEVVRDGIAYLAVAVGGTAILGCWRSGERIPERIARGLRTCADRITADPAAAPAS